MRNNQVSVTSLNYEDPIFLEVSEELHRVYPHTNFNTIDEFQYKKYTKNEVSLDFDFKREYIMHIGRSGYSE